MRKLAIILALLWAGPALAQTQATSYFQLSQTPNYLANGGPGFVQIDANGHPFIAASVPGSGTVTNSANLANNAMVVGDGGGAGIKTVGGSIGGSFTTAGNIAYTGAASGATFALPAGGPFTFTYPLASSTLASLAGAETFTNKTYSGGVLSGTFSGTPTFSGVPKFTGLSAGTQVACLGLDSGNNVVLLLAGCSAGGGGSVSITSLSPNIVVAPSPITGTGTIASTVPLNTQSGNAGYTIVASDAAKVVNRTNTVTQTDPIPQATGSFGSGFGFNYQTGTVGNTLTSTTSTINGIAGTTGIKVGAQQQVAPFSDGTNWHVALGIPQPPTQTGTTFLKDDMTWGTPAGAGTVTNPANLTTNAVAVGGANGTTDVKTLAALGASGTVLTSNGAGVPPSFQAAAGGVTCSTGFTFNTATGHCLWTLTPSVDTTKCAASVACFAWTGLTKNEYRLACRSIIPGGAGTNAVGVQFGEGGTPTWKTANYNVEGIQVSGSGPAAFPTSTNFATFYVGANAISTGTIGQSIDAFFHDLASTTVNKAMNSMNSLMANSGPNLTLFNTAGYYSGDTAAITAIRVFDPTGGGLSIGSGTCTLEELE